jgi:hypothetical protein
MKSKLQVMKFGGTSVGDASCIARAVQIVARAARENGVVVVVSAMTGVTNRLVEAATRAGSGDEQAGAGLIEALRSQHHDALAALVPAGEARSEIARRIGETLAEGQRLFEGTALLREVTPRALDSISSLGERLCAPIFAGALSELGVSGVAIDATELIVTDSYHGGAEPLMDVTRERCGARLRPLLKENAVPVVTGFIGATREGMLTTLGRGGSDYSATILGAAMGADEVIIWTDVDGVLTADPRLVPDARTIPEISYREAAELAYFGAKVLQTGPQHRRGSQGADGDSRCRAHQRGRARDCRRARCGRANVFDHRGVARERAADFAVFLAERHLLHRRGGRCATHGGSAAPGVRTGFIARSGGPHHRRPEDRYRGSRRRKHAWHAGNCRAHLQRAGPRRRQHHCYRAGLVGDEHFVRGGRRRNEASVAGRASRIWTRCTGITLRGSRETELKKSQRRPPQRGGQR